MQRLIPRSFGAVKRHSPSSFFSTARQFSISIPRRANTLMETSGFSDTQLQVREAIAKICSNFPDVSSELRTPVQLYRRLDWSDIQEYWAAHDESGEYPHELHAALAKDGWIGIALPEDLGGSGLGISEATMMLQTISE